MKKYLVGLLTAVMLMFGTPAHAAPTDYFDQTAKVVATDIGCKNIRQAASKPAYKMNSVVCDLKGNRVNVMVFKTSSNELLGKNFNQWSWEADAKHYLPKSFFWASGKGAVIVAKDGNRNAAVVGSKAIKGTVKHG